MTKRQIDPYHVQSVEVSIEDFSGQINGGKSDARVVEERRSHI